MLLLLHNLQIPSLRTPLESGLVQQNAYFNPFQFCVQKQQTSCGLEFQVNSVKAQSRPLLPLNNRQQAWEDVALRKLAVNPVTAKK